MIICSGIQTTQQFNTSYKIGFKSCKQNVCIKIK